jgi:apolipoprotein D and lipocalin family protein
MKLPIFLSALPLLMIACVSTGTNVSPPTVVPHVDLTRYLGVWYEVASFPQQFQKGCSDTQAEYTLKNNGEIEVLNSCFRNGKKDTAKGTAWVVDKTNNAKLKVSFFWPFRGDYWIIDLGSDYEYAVVAGPTRNYLWILAREPRMDKATYAKIVQSLQDRGFDVARLQPTLRSDQKEFK